MDTNSTPKLDKLTPIRIFEQAVEQIRTKIKDGTFPLGTRLPAEQELSTQLNVSRSSVREALRVLETEGLIEARRGSGIYVARHLGPRKDAGDLAKWLEQREETLEQMLQVRESIEGLTASLAATNASADILNELRRINSEISRIVKENNDQDDSFCDDLARLDASFHLAISLASGNDIAHEIISHIIPSFNESNKALLYISTSTQQVEREHRAILEALEARDPAAAEKAVRLHIARVRKEVLELKRANP